MRSRKVWLQFSDYLIVVLSMLMINKFVEEMKSLTNLVLLLSIKGGRETKKISPEIFTKQ